MGLNRPVDVAAAQDPLATSAQNSPALVMNPRNPDNLVVVDRVDLPRFACTMHVSDDGGATWRAVGFPMGAVTTGVACFAPDAAFGPDGALYVSFVSAATDPTNVWVAVSHDGARTFDRVVAAGGADAFHVRLATDPSAAGRVYVTWVQAAATNRWGLVGTANPVVMTRSDDGGATWSPPLPVSGPVRGRVVAPVPAVTPRGELLVVYLDIGDDRLDYEGAHEGQGGEPYAGEWQLVAARSADRGASWTETVVDRLVPARRFVQPFPPFPAVAVGGADVVYLGFADDRRGPGRTMVSVWVSADGGRRWSASRPAGDGELPALAVAPGGRLDVLAYEPEAGSEAVAALRSSMDGGRTFRRPLVLSDQPFDVGIGYGADRGLPELGSRLGLIARDGGALAIWTDTRAGTPATGRQDLAQAVVAVPGSTDARIWRVGGAALVALGVAVWAGTVLALRSARQAGRLIVVVPPSPVVR